jgi:hypothetical protein
MPKGKSDVVYTPPWCARDMVDHFKPSGTVLDPCKGAGVFLRFLPPGTAWCEIAEGVDFYQWRGPVDWVVGNPPYSQTRAWLRHSYRVAANVLYLVPFRNLTSGYGLLEEMRAFGWLRHVRVYGTGGRLGFPMGNAVVAAHVARGYRGDTGFSFYSEVDDAGDGEGPT